MKNLYLLVLAACMLFLACKRDEANTTASGNSSGSQATNVKDQKACIEGNFTPALAPGNSFYENLLVQNWWVMEYYLMPKGNKGKLDRRQTGRWFKFEPDGTFIDGHWQEQIGHGTWRVTFREEKYFLFVDNFCSNRDGEWELQDANNAEDAMSWNAVPGYNDNGAIVKIINLLSRPTKQQFGFQE